MTRLTTIDYDGVTVELRAEENERGFRDAAAATKRRDGCEACGHHLNAHRSGNCTTLVIPADKGWNIANARKCGCSQGAAKRGKAA